jgi:hypothetical protein
VWKCLLKLSSDKLLSLFNVWSNLTVLFILVGRIDFRSPASKDAAEAGTVRRFRTCSPRIAKAPNSAMQEQGGIMVTIFATVFGKGKDCKEIGGDPDSMAPSPSGVE